MSHHDDKVTLRQMLDYSTEALALCQGRSALDFEKDRLWCLAMERLMLNIGEAANRATPAAWQNHPQIPWAQVIAFRNRIVHGYDSVDYNLLWSILEQDVPRLVEQLSQLDLPEFE